MKSHEKSALVGPQWQYLPWLTKSSYILGLLFKWGERKAGPLHGFINGGVPISLPLHLFTLQQLPKN